MAISDNATLYIDKVERVNKVQYLNAFINASYFLKEKTETIEKLGIFLDLFTEKGKCGYDKKNDQEKKKRFSSIYTMGRDFCIWIDEDLELSDLAKDVLDGRITMEYYISNILINYCQIIGCKKVKELIDGKEKQVKKGGNIVHPLYSILIYMKNNKLNSIDSNGFRNIDEFKFYSNEYIENLKNEFESKWINLKNSISNCNSSINIEELELNLKRNKIKEKKFFDLVIQELSKEDGSLLNLKDSINNFKTDVEKIHIFWKAIEQENGNINGWIDLLSSSVFFNNINGNLSVNSKIGSIDEIIHGCNIDMISADVEKIRNDYSEKNQVNYVNKFTLKNDWLYSIFWNDNIVEEEANNSSETQVCTNKIICGAPGSAKSFKINKKYYENKSQVSKRITFHPEYTYNDFIGYIRPIIKEPNEIITKLNTSYSDENYVADECTLYNYEKNQSNITYDFEPGPFTEILCKAFLNNSVVHNLIIEEINRANAASVFGDIFQLLDRDPIDCKSEYKIYNRDIYEYIKKKFKEVGKKIPLKDGEIYIPSNLNIIATMNTADQNVFTIDTAFKRRWEFEYIDIDFKDCEFRNYRISSIDIEWEKFVRTINKFMMSIECSDLMIPEDKQIGPFFVKKTELYDSKKFAYKVLMYLWDDVFKMERERVFNPEIRTFSQVVNKFDSKNAIDIFNEDIKKILKDDDYIKEYVELKNNEVDQVVGNDTPKDGDTDENR